MSYHEEQAQIELAEARRVARWANEQVHNHEYALRQAEITLERVRKAAELADWQLAQALVAAGEDVPEDLLSADDRAALFYSVAEDPED